MPILIVILFFTVINDRNLNDNRGLYFGNRFSAEEYFDGRMDDIQIYNRGLSASEIKLNYERNKKSMTEKTTILPISNQGR